MSDKVEPASHVPEKMRGPNRGDLQTKLKYHDQTDLDQSWIQVQKGTGKPFEKLKHPTAEELANKPTDAPPSRQK